MVALLLFFCGAVQAAVTPELWATRDSLALNRAAATEAERLLASTAREHDPQRVLSAMRRLSRLEAPVWMRREALGALCEYFCVTGKVDSLTRRSEELQALGAAPWDCPVKQGKAATAGAAPASAESGNWWLQVGAFSSEKAAQSALKGLDAPKRRRVLREGKLWKARLGPFPSRVEAERSAAELTRAGRLKDYRVVAE